MRDGAGFANEIIETDAPTNQHPVFNHLERARVETRTRELNTSPWKLRRNF